DLFHWESQNSTTVASPTGQRYLHHRERGTHVALFVRDAPTDDLGPAPFLCLGLCDYVAHQGERPIAVTWRLRRRMPGGDVPSGERGGVLRRGGSPSAQNMCASGFSCSSR